MSTGHWAHNLLQPQRDNRQVESQKSAENQALRVRVCISEGPHTPGSCWPHSPSFRCDVDTFKRSENNYWYHLGQ